MVPKVVLAPTSFAREISSAYPPSGINFRSPDMIPSCGERLLRGYGETEAEVTARVVDDFCVQFLTYFRQGFRAMG